MISAMLIAVAIVSAPKMQFIGAVESKQNSQFVSEQTTTVKTTSVNADCPCAKCECVKGECKSKACATAPGTPAASAACASGACANGSCQSSTVTSTVEESVVSEGQGVVSSVRSGFHPFKRTGKLFHRFRGNRCASGGCQ